MREFLLAIDTFSRYLAENQKNTVWSNIPVGEFTRETLVSEYAASDPPFVDKMSCTITIQESVQ